MSWYGVKYPKIEEYVPPTWTDGTNAEIIEALEKHYASEIDLTEYWSVGDERTISLNAISATQYSEAQSAQDVIFVLLNVGGKELVTPINGISECVFIVGQKDCLTTAGSMYPISTTLVNTGWNNIYRRTWCNNNYYNAIPLSIRSIFKQHYNYLAGSYDSTTPTQSADYFCLPSVKEVTNSTQTNGYGWGASAGAEANNTQLEYYVTSANRTKILPSDVESYWTSSKSYYTRTDNVKKCYFCYVYEGGTGTYKQETARGIAPQGVI